MADSDRLAGHETTDWSRSRRPERRSHLRSGRDRLPVHDGYTRVRQVRECSGHERSRPVIRNRRSADQGSHHQASFQEAGQSSSLPTSTTRSRSVTCSFAFSKHPLGTLDPCWVRDGLAVGVLEPVGELLEPVGEQVPIAVQRHRRRCVAELGPDRLDAGALGDEQRRAGVPKLVQAQRLGQPGHAERRLQQRTWTAEDGSARSEELPLVATGRSRTADEGSSGVPRHRRVGHLGRLVAAEPSTWQRRRAAFDGPATDALAVALAPDSPPRCANGAVEVGTQGLGHGGLLGHEPSRHGRGREAERTAQLAHQVGWAA